eukprot:gene2122-5162_t
MNVFQWSFVINHHKLTELRDDNVRTRTSTTLNTSAPSTPAVHIQPTDGLIRNNTSAELFEKQDRLQEQLEDNMLTVTQAYDSDDDDEFSPEDKRVRIMRGKIMPVPCTPICHVRDADAVFSEPLKLQPNIPSEVSVYMDNRIAAATDRAGLKQRVETIHITTRLS